MRSSFPLRKRLAYDPDKRLKKAEVPAQSASDLQQESIRKLPYAYGDRRQELLDSEDEVHLEHLVM